ncbi:MAG: NAD(P)/FAD-dependent oxidoreductase [Candidatus Hadarchaeales archaeon]
MIYPDVLIVGAGPCGSFLAKILSEKGLEVVVVEEHPQIGHPSCCAGIVGIRGMRALGIKKEDWVLGELKSAQFFSSSGLSSKIGRGGKEAWVIDRAAFDRWLAEEALNAGAEFYLSTRCIGIDCSTSKVKLSGVFSGFAKPSIIIGSDGFSSIVRKSLGLDFGEFTFCAQIETKGEIEEGTAEIYLGQRFSPGFFAWGVRAGDVCRIGLGTTSGNPVRYLRNLIAKHPGIAGRVKQKVVVSAGVKAIPRTFLSSPARDNFLLVGDAAGQVKQITGGGIFLGMFCANIAALSILRAFEEEKPKKASKFYIQMFRKELLSELEVSKLASRFLFNLSDKKIDTLVSLLEDQMFIGIVKSAFDFEFHSSLIKALIPVFPEILGKLKVRRKSRL